MSAIINAFWFFIVLAEHLTRIAVWCGAVALFAAALGKPPVETLVIVIVANLFGLCFYPLGDR
jgi:hypothetical protein